MFKLGDKVVSKRTGYPGVGEVCGIVYARFYIATTQKQVSDFQCWNEIYPDWTEKAIIYVIFDKSRKTITKEEFAKYLPEQYKKFDLDTMYAMQVPFVNIVGYPVDDLEYLDKDDDTTLNIIKGVC